MKKPQPFYLILLSLTLLVSFLIWKASQPSPPLPFTVKRVELGLFHEGKVQKGTIRHSPTNRVHLLAFVQYQTKTKACWAGYLPSGVEADKTMGFVAEELNPWPFSRFSIRFTYVTLEAKHLHYAVANTLPTVEYDFYPVAFGENLWEAEVPFASHNAHFLSSPPCGAWLGEKEKVGTLRFALRIDVFPTNNPQEKQTFYSTPFSHAENALTLIQQDEDLPFPLPFYSSFAYLPSLSFAPEVSESAKGKVSSLFQRFEAYGTLLWHFYPQPAGKETSVTFDLKRPMKWGKDVHPGDSIIFQDTSFILVKDSGIKGIVDPEDEIWVNLHAPLCSCSLGEVVSSPLDGLLFCPHVTP